MEWAGTGVACMEEGMEGWAMEAVCTGVMEVACMEAWGVMGEWAGTGA